MVVSPLFIAQALSIGASYIGDLRNAKAMARFNQERQDVSVQNAATQASGNYGALLERQRQTKESAAASIRAANKSAIEASSSARVANIESGGTSAEQTSFAQDLSEFVGLKDRQFAFEQGQIERQLESIQISQDNAVIHGEAVQGPDAFATMTNIMSAYWQSQGVAPTTGDDAIEIDTSDYFTDPNDPSIKLPGFNF